MSEKDTFYWRYGFNVYEGKKILKVKNLEKDLFSSLKNAMIYFWHVQDFELFKVFLIFLKFIYDTI